MEVDSSGDGEGGVFLSAETGIQPMRYSYVTATEQGHYLESKTDCRLAAVVDMLGPSEEINDD